MPPGQKLVSYDVTALFTSMPVDQALTIIREKLHEDTTFKQRCQLDVEQVIELLGLCLNTTYFVHNNKFYQQTHGAAMGSPVSPIVCNLYMENFEKIALSSAPSPPSMWLRYVDDTFVKIHEYDVDGQCLIYWHACEQGGYIIRYKLLARRHIEILQCVSEFFAVLDAVDCFALKPVNTLRSILIHPKDKTPKDKKCGGHIRDNMRSGPCTRVHR